MQQNKTVRFPGFHCNLDKSKWMAIGLTKEAENQDQKTWCKSDKKSTSCLKDGARVPYEHCFVTS